MSKITFNYFNIDKYVTPKVSRTDTMNKVYEAQQEQINSINKNLQDIIDNIFIDTATWGIDLFEEEYGLEKIIDDTIENRRSRVKAKMRGYGACTKQHIKNVALSYGYGEIEPIEHFEDYILEIKFISTMGIPPRIEDFKKTMREIVPAHIVIEYSFKFNTWQDVLNIGTWQEIKNKGTWNDIKNK